MSLLDAGKIVATTIASMGGAVAIILTLSGWLGKVWANRIFEEDRKKHSVEIERLKSDLAIQQTRFLKHADHEFSIYNECWTLLCDLKISGDELWLNADDERLLQFADQLRATRKAVLKSALVIEDMHYVPLTRLIEEFSEYRVGKQNLLSLRRDKSGDNPYGYALMEHSIVEDNRQRKEAYDGLILQIQRSFKSKIALAKRLG